MNLQPLIEELGDQKWLDVSDPVQRALREALAAIPELKNFLHGTWLGHPLHPVLTDIPVGAWTVAALLDAAELFTGRETGGADFAVAVGLAGAVGSAITGIADWSETDNRAKRLGAIHGTLNLIAASLYTTSLVMRAKKGTRQRAIALSMAGYAIASASAYLGGHLVFGEQIGVDHTATEHADDPAHFTRLIAVDELEDGVPRKARVGEVDVCVVRMGDEIFAVHERCPHLGGPLSEGTLEGATIRCPWHGSQFALRDGEVINGPSASPARALAVRVRDGQVEVRSA